MKYSAEIEERHRRLTHALALTEYSSPRDDLKLFDATRAMQPAPRRRPTVELRAVTPVQKES